MPGVEATFCAILLVAACVGAPVVIIFVLAGIRYDPMQGASVDESELEG